MTILRLTVTALFAVFLTGCVSTGVVPDDYTGPTAVLADSSDNLVIPEYGILNPKRFVTPPKVDMFYAFNIDGKRIETIGTATYQRNQYRGFNIDVVPVERRIPIKPLTVEIAGQTYHAADIGGIFGESYFVKGTVTFTPAPNTRYVVRGALSKTYSAVWIETSGGRIVTKKIEKRSPAES